MKVIKLGGSLINDKNSLIQCLNTIEQKSNDKVVIVPGGGLFADQVRILQNSWGFDDQIAHNMALLSMHQMALLINSIKQNFMIVDKVSLIKQEISRFSVVIWKPDIDELNSSTVEASWNVTSDSLAAWLANQLTVTELILVKSIHVPLNLDIDQMQNRGIVDKAFRGFTQEALYTITITNKQRFNEKSNC